MLRITEQNGVALVDLSGDLNRKNILPLRDNILGEIQPGIKTIEFHFENVEKMDAPAMAMMVIIAKKLLALSITSKVSGLAGECKDLATFLGLHLVAEVEGRGSILRHC